MAKGFNQVTLMGNLTKAPELRTTPAGQSVCNLSLAVNSKFGDNEKVDFFDCTAWGKAGEIIEQYCSKGSTILVSGRLDQRQWEQDGQKRSKVEVVVENFNFIGGKEVVTETQPKQEDSVQEDEPINLGYVPF